MIKCIKSLCDWFKKRSLMNSYIKELKKEKPFRLYNLTCEDAIAIGEKITIERVVNKFVIDIPDIDKGIQSTIGDSKASFVPYNNQ